MARGLKGRIRVIIEMDEYESGEGAGAAVKRLPHGFEWEWEFTSGTTDGTQMDRAWSSKPALTTTPVDTDIVGTSNLADVLDGSNNVNLTDLCVMAAVNLEGSGGGDIDIGGGSAPVDLWTLAAGDGVAVKPAGIFLWVAPYGIQPTATTADILRAVASAGTVNGRILIAGRST